jgi:CheY-like chemotaxis protein
MQVQEKDPGPVDILIAEDSTPARISLRRLLEQEGYRCVEAGDGEEALQLAAQHLPHWVLLDLAHSRPDGCAVARQLRADSRTSDAVILHIIPPDVLEAGEPMHRGLSKFEAEELLDWLQAHGVACVVDYEEGLGFSVRRR